MNGMNNMKKKYLIIGIILIIILSIGTTFAWYTWSSSDEDETKIVTSLGAITVYYDSGSNIEGIRLKPSATKEEGIIKTITVKSDQESKYKLSFNLYLDINTLPDGLKDASFKYELYKIGTEEAIVSGDFTQTSLDTNLVSCTTNNTNHIVLVSDETITTEVSTYVLYIWIDGNMQNDMDMQNQDFEFKIHADGQNAILGETLVQHITSLYENADKTVVSNGAEGSQTQYNYATSVSLMNDRLGGVTSNYDAGNIRYYGKNPNNYIDIGEVYTERYSVLERCLENIKEQLVLEGVDCNHYSDSGFSSEEECNATIDAIVEMNCGTEDIIYEVGDPKLYRIIGLFKNIEKSDGTTEDLIKVVSNENIGYYSWDTSASDVNSGWGINEWNQADLMKLLNPGYTDNNDFNNVSSSIVVNNSLYWTGGSSSCYAMRYNMIISCDFTTKAIGNYLQSKIEGVKWNLGGHNSSYVYSNQIYGYERGKTVVTNPSDGVERTTEWTGKVALMYPSDYGYATDFSKCSSTLANYNTSGCYDNDWLSYKTDKAQWLLTPNPGFVFDAWGVYYDGSVYSSLVGYGYAVWPVFYLDSGLTIVSGNGSKTNPYLVS